MGLLFKDHSTDSEKYNISSSGTSTPSKMEEMYYSQVLSPSSKLQEIPSHCLPQQIYTQV